MLGEVVGAHLSLVQPIGGVAGVELVEHAAEGVDVDGGVAPELFRAGEVAREHLGRRVLGGTVPPDVGPLREGAAGGPPQQGGAPKVDEADVEVLPAGLLAHVEARCSEHDVLRREVAVDETAVEAVRRGEHVEHGHAERSDRAGGNARAVRRRLGLEGVAGGLEGLAHDPLHENRRLPLDGAMPVEVGEPPQVGEGELGRVLLVEGVPAAPGLALAPDEVEERLLERHGVPAGVPHVQYPSRAALEPIIALGPEDDRVAAERLGLVLVREGEGGLEVIDLDRDQLPRLLARYPLVAHMRLPRRAQSNKAVGGGGLENVAQQIASGLGISSWAESCERESEVLR